MVYEQSDSLKPAADRVQARHSAGPGRNAAGASVPALNNPRLLAALFSDDSIKNQPQHRGRGDQPGHPGVGARGESQAREPSSLRAGEGRHRAAARAAGGRGDGEKAGRRAARRARRRGDASKAALRSVEAREPGRSQGLAARGDLAGVRGRREQAAGLCRSGLERRLHDLPRFARRRRPARRGAPAQRSERAGPGERNPAVQVFPGRPARGRESGNQPGGAGEKVQ